MDHVAGRLDAVDLGEAELDPVMQLRSTRADDLVRVGQAEGHEQQARLVDVAVVAIDDHDLDTVAVRALQAVGRERPAGPGTQDDDAMADVHIANVVCAGAGGARRGPQARDGQLRNRQDAPMPPLGVGVTRSFARMPASRSQMIWIP